MELFSIISEWSKVPSVVPISMSSGMGKFRSMDDEVVFGSSTDWIIWLIGAIMLLEGFSLIIG